jgi:hypothetical protein
VKTICRSGTADADDEDDDDEDDDDEDDEDEDDDIKGDVGLSSRISRDAVCRKVEKLKFITSKTVLKQILF